MVLVAGVGEPRRRAAQRSRVPRLVRRSRHGRLAPERPARLVQRPGALRLRGERRRPRAVGIPRRLRGRRGPARRRGRLQDAPRGLLDRVAGRLRGPSARLLTQRDRARRVAGRPYERALAAQPVLSSSGYQGIMFMALRRMASSAAPADQAPGLQACKQAGGSGASEQAASRATQPTPPTRAAAHRQVAGARLALRRHGPLSGGRHGARGRAQQRSWRLHARGRGRDVRARRHHRGGGRRRRRGPRLAGSIGVQQPCLQSRHAQGL